MNIGFYRGYQGQHMQCPTWYNRVPCEYRVVRGAFLRPQLPVVLPYTYNRSFVPQPVMQPFPPPERGACCMPSLVWLWNNTRIPLSQSWVEAALPSTNSYCSYGVSPSIREQAEVIGDLRNKPFIEIPPTQSRVDAAAQGGRPSLSSAGSYYSCIARPNLLDHIMAQSDLIRELGDELHILNNQNQLLQRELYDIKTGLGVAYARPQTLPGRFDDIAYNFHTNEYATPTG